MRLNWNDKLERAPEWTRGLVICPRSDDPHGLLDPDQFGARAPRVAWSKIRDNQGDYRRKFYMLVDESDSDETPGIPLWWDGALVRSGWVWIRDAIIHANSAGKIGLSTGGWVQTSEPTPSLDIVTNVARLLLDVELVDEVFLLDEHWIGTRDQRKLRDDAGSSW